MLSVVGGGWSFSFDWKQKNAKGILLLRDRLCRFRILKFTAIIRVKRIVIKSSDEFRSAISSKAIKAFAFAVAVGVAA